MRYLGLLALLLSCRPALASPPVFLLRDVGVIGLMSHDIFAWDHHQNVNTENGRLDLSTIFDYGGGARWEKGGNPKNGENAPVYTVTMDLVHYYKYQRKRGLSHEEARRETVRFFHGIVKETYERVVGRPFPEARLAMPTNRDQAVLRGLHDILPGRVHLIGRYLDKELDLTSFSTRRVKLNRDEMNQEIRTFDGEYDPEFKAIFIPAPPWRINLQTIDGKFIETYGGLNQAAILSELRAVGRGEKSFADFSLAGDLDALFAKAVCSEGNEWMPPVACR